MAVAERLKAELETFEKHHERLLAESPGKYVLIAKDRIDGIWDTYEDALKAGYSAHGLAPFLVKRIVGPESVQFITRDVL